jgi:hypothetical protein
MGESGNPEFTFENGETTIYYTAYETDSLLLNLKKFSKGDEVAVTVEDFDVSNPSKIIDFKAPVDYTLNEPNVLVLDMPKWSLDGVNFEDKEEILKIDTKIRSIFNYPVADGREEQPWVIGKETEFKQVYLKFNFESDVATSCSFAFERADEVILNGEKVEINVDGYFTDRHIFTTKLPNLKVGENELIVKTVISKRISIENYFILGDFGVEVKGKKLKIDLDEDEDLVIELDQPVEDVKAALKDDLEEIMSEQEEAEECNRRFEAWKRSRALRKEGKRVAMNRR